MPSAFRAMRIPEPPEPDIQRPDLMHEKMASPTAFCIIRGGIFFVTVVKVVDVLVAGVGTVGLVGTES